MVAIKMSLSDRQLQEACSANGLSCYPLSSFTAFTHRGCSEPVTQQPVVGRHDTPLVDSLALSLVTGFTKIFL